MSVINTNISATIATNALIRNERDMSTSMERLSTGMRINSAKDDAAGLAISSRMSAMVTGLEMASKKSDVIMSSIIFEKILLFLLYRSHKFPDPLSLWTCLVGCRHLVVGIGQSRKTRDFPNFRSL